MDAFEEDRGEVLERAALGGVGLFITVPARKGDAAGCAALAAADARIFATAGLHPHEARLWDAEAEAEVRAAIKQPRVVAVGEIGLDFHYDLSPHDRQKEVFRTQIGIAREARLPIVIHTRSARSDTLDILREEGAREIGGVLHCFTEDAQTASALVDLGFFVSFSGIVTFPKAGAIQEAARRVPLEYLLVETDAPFLAPVPHRGRRNEPSYLEATIGFIAALRGTDLVSLAERTYENCRRAFRLDTAP